MKKENEKIAMVTLISGIIFYFLYKALDSFFEEELLFVFLEKTKEALYPLYLILKVLFDYQTFIWGLLTLLGFVGLILYLKNYSNENEPKTTL